MPQTHGPGGLFSSLTIRRFPGTGSWTPHGGPTFPCSHSGGAHIRCSRAGSGRQLGPRGLQGTLTSHGLPSSEGDPATGPGHLERISPAHRPLTDKRQDYTAEAERLEPMGSTPRRGWRHWARPTARAERRSPGPGPGPSPTPSPPGTAAAPRQAGRGRGAAVSPARQ